MELAIVGGTGDIGEGLALRFAKDTSHSITLGSRDTQRAQDAASDYRTKLRTGGFESNIDGTSNNSAVSTSDLSILCVPPYHIRETVDSLRDALAEQIVVTPAVGMNGDEDGLHYRPPPTGSITELVADCVSTDTPVIGAFHNLAAARLAQLDAALDVDTLVVGDDQAAKAVVMELASELTGVRALDAGPLANSAEVESVTPLLINIARYNSDLHNVGVKFH